MRVPAVSGRVLALLLLSLMLLSGCAGAAPAAPASEPLSTAIPSHPASPSSPTPVATEEAMHDTSLVIHLLNASRTRSPVDIQLFLDGELVADEQLVSGHLLPAEEPMPSITPHLTYDFPLERGSHSLRALSRAGEAIFDTTVEISGRHWALLGYEYGTAEEGEQEKRFTFIFQSEPILFQ